MATTKAEGLALMRKPFPQNQISKLPKPTKRQTEELRADFKKGQRCELCGGWHQKDVVHLDYVGHAALTDRLLDVDPVWSWEPLSMGQDGLPVMDHLGGMWIRLTVCGISRLGYGHAGDKKGGDAIKEVIGDALRNAAMRFGAALDLWHKGDLHADDDGSAGKEQNTDQKPDRKPDMSPKARAGRIMVGVSAGDAAGAAFALSQLDEPTLNAIWEHIDEATQAKLTAAWPKRPGA